MLANLLCDIHAGTITERVGNPTDTEVFDKHEPDEVLMHAPHISVAETCEQSREVGSSIGADVQHL
jgi:hypothetical protein